MPDPRWTGPPEIVAAIFEAGSPASVVANSAVWVTETVNNEVAAGVSQVNSLVTAEQWQGVGSAASTIAGAGLNTALQMLVGWTAEKIGVTQAAVEAFAVARSSVIPSVVSQTNRDEWAVLNATNFLGQNTPAIIERDTEYFGEHWPHNSGIGWAYAAALNALVAALAAPPPVAPMGASPAAPATAAQAVAQAAAQTGMHNAVQGSAQVAQTAGQSASAPAQATGQLGSLAQLPAQVFSSATAPLKDLAGAPAQAMQGLAGMGPAQAFGGMFPPAALPVGAMGAAGSVLAAGSVSGGAGGGVGGGVGGGAVSAGGPGAAGGFPGAGLTSYTRPNSSFESEAGGKPASLRAGMLNAAEVRGPTTSGAMGGTPLPMRQAGMLARGGGGSGGGGGQEAVTRARVVVEEEVPGA
ncbi:PPE domain-containing protein [Mycobacterium sp.]|uniref:PPE domain-containing protein n=1 Tax=Mycobacterium sp. TaxID=1785 RepID=UPI003A89291B